jgi:hypothetical protein
LTPALHISVSADHLQHHARCAFEFHETLLRPFHEAHLLPPEAPEALAANEGAIWHGRRTWAQVDVDWDNGRKRMLVVPPYECEVLEVTGTAVR